MENISLITVIVPCYNVEKYIDKCISSIVNQSYSHLEILLVNDGSTDNTGKICDEWQERDSRIRVIHKQNEGTSCARKTGVEQATADYIAFVDADDWIDANMYKDLMTALLSTHSDIAQCALCWVNADGRKENRLLDGYPLTTTLGRIEGVVLILEDYKWRTNLYAKIYKKNLFNHITFPAGRGYGEDMIVSDLFHHAAQTVLLNCAYYFYLLDNDSSISRKGNIGKEMKKISDFHDALYERYSFVMQHPEYHNALPYTKYMAICFGMSLLHNITAYPQYFTDEYSHAKVHQMRSMDISRMNVLPFRIKVEWHSLKMGKKIHQFIISFFVRIIRTTNKLKITNRSLYYAIPHLYWIWRRYEIFDKRNPR